MAYRITSQFERIEKQKQTFLHFLSSWTPQQLRFKPSATSWSALEVIDHVLKTESGIFAEMQSNLPLSRTTTFQNRFRGFLLNTLMSSPVRLKVPVRLSVVLPGTARDLSELAAAWSHVRTRQKEWIANLGPSHARIALFHHPVSGWMTPSQTFGFLSAHLHHHGYQLARIRHDPAWARCAA